MFSTCNLSISGPSTLLGEATYSIADLPADATVQWSTSNTNITLVSQGGDSALFRSDYYGDCTITANIAAGGSSVSLSRPVFADIDLSHLNNTYVNASDFACGQASFTMMNLPSGSFVKWSCGIGTTHTPDTDATYSFYTSGYPPSHPGVDKMMTQITYKGKTQEWEDEFNFNFDRPYLSYQVGDSILEIDYGYINNGSAWITVQYNYPFNGISGEWSSLTPGWILMPGYTGEYAAFEGSADISFITVQLCFDTPCGSRACYTRDFIPPQYLYGNSPDGFIVYPNPATHTVTVDLSDIKTNADSRAVALKDYRIQLWSASGLLRELRTERQTCQLSLSGIPAGLYFVHVIKDGKKYRKKLIVR